MKPAYRAAGGIFGLVVLGGLVSAAVFVGFGSQIAVYAAVAIVPVLAVSGGLWARRTIQTTGTDQAQFTRRRAHEIGDDFTDVVARRNRMGDAFPGVVDEIDAGIAGLAADMREQGISPDLDAATYDLGSVTSLQDVNQLDGRVADVSDRLDAAFTEQSRSAVDAIANNIDRLDEIGPESFGYDRDDVPDATGAETDWRDAGDVLESCRADAVAAIEESADAVRATGESAGDVEMTPLDAQLSAARTAATEHDFSRAVNELLEARDTIRRDGSSAFESLQRDLESLLDLIEGSNADEYVPQQHLADLSAERAAIDSLDDAIGLTDLQSHRAEIEGIGTDIVRTLEGKLDDIVRTLEDADVPAGYYTVPAVVEEDCVADVEEAATLPEYQTAWEDAVDRLTQALDTLQPKADVVSGFDAISSQIETELRESGRVTGSDLPVRDHHDQFLGLYYRKHPDEVEFDAGIPSLVATGADETYELDVTVTFDEGGQERDVEIAIDGTDHHETRTVSTPLTSTETFADLPFGDYAVTVSAAPAEYPTVERELHLQGDDSIDVSLAPASLRERRCEGMDDDVDEYLEPLEETFSDRFESEGHLSTEMSFRIDDEYVPCLLATWAERSGHDAVERDAQVLVYDSATLTKELENVVEYNLDDGEAVEYDELRERFLSAPVPDSVVESLAEECTKDVAATATGVTKQ